MGQWSFVIAAYVLTLAGTLALSVVSLLDMKRAERRADEATKQP